MLSNLLPASLLSLSYIVTAASAAPFKFADNPLGNSFPNPNQQQTLDIQTQAHGSLPNGAPPATINPNTLTSLRLIAFNELFEVAFFSSLLNNMTTNATGFEFQSSSARDTALAAVTAILAQEELHALNANGALSHFNTPPIQPCQYTFPTTTYDDAIALASTFTDLVLGTLQDVSSLMGSNGDAGLIRSITSVLGQEGEQNGFFRSTSNKIPSALPFLTASTREFAFSALNQNFVVPGSCDPSNLATIDLPIFPPLSVLTQKITAKEQMLRFSLEFETGAGTPGKIWKEQMGMQYDDLSVAYINQQNLPAVQKIQNLDLTASGLTFEAIFPFQEGTFGNGLTIAVLARSGGDLTTVEGVASATVFGPGLIEVN
ncbi:putative sexual development protein [Cadophora sp. MPI-SDFR-AT-0126]|nr:putative sexual development protein [Leotiomycetes sp. MPI-SDFR-AT-0126]